MQVQSIPSAYYLKMQTMLFIKQKPMGEIKPKDTLSCQNKLWSVNLTLDC
jgi:hypothetical protein